MSKFSLVLDSSQITTFLECPTQWYNQYYKRLVPTYYIQDRSAMNAGTYGHKLLDIYYKGKAKHFSMNDCIGMALAYDPDIDTCVCGCHKDQHRLIDLLQIDPCNRCKHCTNFRAHPFDLAKETRIAVQNRFREYCFFYQNNDFVPDSQEHVEVGFSEPIYEDNENLFALEGRIDLIGSLQGLSCVADHKWQMQRHWIYPESLQFKNYALVAKKTMFIINYIRLAKTMDKTTMVRQPVSFSALKLLDWKQKLIKIFFQIKRAIETNNYEQRWSSCKGYGKCFDLAKPSFCPYTKLCEEPSEEVRVMKQNQLYEIKKEIWRPW